MMDKQKNKYYYLKGIKNGMPICLGYLAVSFTLGITARSRYDSLAGNADQFCLPTHPPDNMPVLQLSPLVALILK